MGPTRMRLTKPVIAAIEGYAVAGGLELALWADLRVAARDAQLGVFCRRWGVPLIDGGTVRLPRLIGESRALDLILTGRVVSAVEAEAIGLVNRVSEPGGALVLAGKLAAELAALPQTCLREDRLSVLEQWGRDEQAAMAVELEHGQISLGADALGGARRFAEGAGRHGAPGLGPERPTMGRAIGPGSMQDSPRTAGSPVWRTKVVALEKRSRISRGRCAERE